MAEGSESLSGLDISKVWLFIRRLHLTAATESWRQNTKIRNVRFYAKYDLIVTWRGKYCLTPLQWRLTAVLTVYFNDNNVSVLYDGNVAIFRIHSDTMCLWDYGQDSIYVDTKMKENEAAFDLVFCPSGRFAQSFPTWVEHEFSAPWHQLLGV